MLKCVSQPQLEKFARTDSGYSCDTNDEATSPSPPTASSGASAAANVSDDGYSRSSLSGKRSSSGSTACLKDCVLGSLTKDDGANVGLDNKIEQAMDLVKGHLMFAVREEIEVLKDRIKNLVARNSQLEQENAFLSQYASPETMTKVQTIRQQQPLSTTGLTT